MASVKITFIGHASFLFEADGEKIFFDPWLAPENPVAKMTLDDITEATTVCVTHGHIDHLGQAIGIVKKTNACLICSPEVGMYCDLHGIPYDEAPTMYALNVGGSAKWGKATYTAVPAVHSTNIMGDEYRANKTMMPDGQTMGFVITFDNGIALYDSGDTGVTMDMQIIQRLYQPELCIMPAGGQYNMGIREFALACEFLKPKVVIPCHYDTFPRQRQDIEKLKEAVTAASPGTQVVKMLPGETWTYER